MADQHSEYEAVFFALLERVHRVALKSEAPRDAVARLAVWLTEERLPETSEFATALQDLEDVFTTSSRRLADELLEAWALAWLNGPIKTHPIEPGNAIRSAEDVTFIVSYAAYRLELRRWNLPRRAGEVGRSPARRHDVSSLARRWRVAWPRGLRELLSIAGKPWRSESVRRMTEVALIAALQEYFPTDDVMAAFEDEQPVVHTRALEHVPDDVLPLELPQEFEAGLERVILPPPPKPNPGRAFLRGLALTFGIAGPPRPRVSPSELAELRRAASGR